ncbi:MAG: hypothetical protein FJZ00_05805 [Candidatus Sericytochromatia bacterium]|uniref:Uncharacterized protein n=1 Tax=Candidatus Tanganyikabacteria bacterium TaxID=2961651 RepID=A0A937X2B3_9BACT|nr:hypothetical protein [Candidatus Tanganyikabacteria bacterium]
MPVDHVIADEWGNLLLCRCDSCEAKRHIEELQKREEMRLEAEMRRLDEQEL